MRRLHILPFLLLACCACTNDLDFEYRQMPRELLLSSQLRSNAGTHTVFAAMGDARRIQSADGLQITCYVNGARIADAVPGEYESVSTPVYLNASVPQQSVYRFDATFAPGDRITLQVSGADGALLATGETVFTGQPELSAVDTVSIITPGRWQPDNVTREFRVDVSLRDSAGEDNWYMVEAAMLFDAVLHGPGKADLPVREEEYLRIIAGDDPILSDGVILSNEELFGTISSNQYNCFSDRLFKDATGTFSFKLDPNSVNGKNYVPRRMREGYNSATVRPRLEIRVEGISQLEYNYLRALGIQTMGSFFNDVVEPSSLPDNIDGASGFIGTLTTACRAFELPVIELDYSWYYE